jgi:hypothetical protein
MHTDWKIHYSLQVCVFSVGGVGCTVTVKLTLDQGGVISFSRLVLWKHRSWVPAAAFPAEVFLKLSWLSEKNGYLGHDFLISNQYLCTICDLHLSWKSVIKHLKSESGSQYRYRSSVWEGVSVAGKGYEIESCSLSLLIALEPSWITSGKCEGTL